MDNNMSSWQNFCTFTFECSARLHLLWNYRCDLSGARKYRRARPYKRLGQFCRIINVNGDISSNTCPCETHLSVFYGDRFSACKEQRLRGPQWYINFYTNTSGYSLLGVHYADGHSCSLKIQGTWSYIRLSMTRYSVTHFRWAGRCWSLDLCPAETGICHGRLGLDIIGCKSLKSSLNRRKVRTILRREIYALETYESSDLLSILLVAASALGAQGLLVQPGPVVAWEY